MLVFGVKVTGYDDTWVYIDDALQGSIRGLRCPFCDTSLVAQKAAKDKLAYFKHRKKACRWVRVLRRVLYYFPIIDYWQYGLSPLEQQLFRRLQRKRSLMDNDTFISYHTETSTVLLLGKERFPFGYESLGKSKYDRLEKLLQWKLIQVYNHSFGVDCFRLTWKAEVLSSKDWSLKKFYKEIIEYLEDRYCYPRWDDITINGLFYEMNRRQQRAYFYLLKITFDNQTLYKTGTTMLSYEKIEKWERKQLKGFAKRITIERVYYVDSISLIEPFIRLKYKKYIYKIGHKTGYFDFKNKAAEFLKDVHQVTLLSDSHKEKIKAGLKNAENVGKRGKETIDGFLNKSSSKTIIAFLEDDEEVHSLRAIARYSGHSINTVRKVKRLWEGQKESDS